MTPKKCFVILKITFFFSLQFFRKMAATATKPIVSFDLLYAIRETQLQHGLRSDDFAKYHHYCTGRIKTLRKQLKLSNAHRPVAAKKKNNNNNNNNKDKDAN